MALLPVERRLVNGGGGDGSGGSGGGGGGSGGGGGGDSGGGLACSCIFHANFSCFFPCFQWCVRPGFLVYSGKYIPDFHVLVFNSLVLFTVVLSEAYLIMVMYVNSLFTMAPLFTVV